MLWVARDRKKGGAKYVVFWRKPHVRCFDGTWYSEGGGVAISERFAPVKLKPGEGPVRVRLVLEEEEAAG